VADLGQLVNDDEPARPAGPVERRPFIERAGIAAIAIVLAGLFGWMGLAAWIGDEVFLAVMAWTGALMTLWAAGSSLPKR
jgi:hypothetical protein